MLCNTQTDQILGKWTHVKQYPSDTNIWASVKVEDLGHHEGISLF